MSLSNLLARLRAVRSAAARRSDSAADDEFYLALNDASALRTSR